MIQGLRIFTLTAAIISMAAAVWVHTRLKASPTDRWSARGTILLSIGMICGTIPGLFFRGATGVSIAGSLVSMVFTAGSFVTLRHMRRRLRSTASHDARR